ncbi:MAG TPA: hypothetical protein PLK67_20675 [Bryobacteraceae bacterium]|nr:hypothetical protein [Bryobacteraceae bacterium]
MKRAEAHVPERESRTPAERRRRSRRGDGSYTAGEVVDYLLTG